MTSDSTRFQVLVARIEAAIRNICPDLHGQCVLTEAASGPYITTAVTAAVAGATQVRACTRHSQWGTVDEIKRMTFKLAEHFGVADRIEITTRSAVDMAKGVDVVTNLGFVRPITRALIQQLPNHATIALMWEPWEFRAEDIDLSACREFDIPIVATNERHPNLATFKAVGMLALKLLLEQQCEVAGLDLVVVGSDPFGQACYDLLSTVGARVTLLDPRDGWPSDGAVSAFESADAVVLAEHRHKGELLGPSASTLVESLSRRGGQLVHICGVVDADYLASKGVIKHPACVVPPGFMTLTTAYVGIKPVVDLHTAGLHVASIVARERQKGCSIDMALNKAVASNYGLRLLDSAGREARS